MRPEHECCRINRSPSFDAEFDCCYEAGNSRFPEALRRPDDSSRIQLQDISSSTYTLFTRNLIQKNGARWVDAVSEGAPRVDEPRWIYVHGKAENGPPVKEALRESEINSDLGLKKIAKCGILDTISTPATLGSGIDMV